MYVEQFSSPRTHHGAAARAEVAFLPSEAPLDMPEQRFDRARGLAELDPAPADQMGLEVDRLLARRLCLIFGSFLLGLFASNEIGRPLAADGIDLLDTAFLLIFFGLFAWIAFGFLSAAAGFLVLMGNGPGMPRWMRRTRLPRKRTAVLAPIYNEDVDAVFARLAAMTESTAAIQAQHLFDFFVLSDSHADTEPREIRAFRRLRAISLARVYYRRRPANVARKPGNISEWVRRFGGAYEHMIVLDADSLMSGAAMARMAAAMEDQPGIGLIQTIPTIINGRTLFARWQQFAAIAYGTISAAGLQWWSGSEATFWGHNAIIRVRAFAESCGLPLLSGKEPFGGHIMSHDMVEAALLRRRGWAVRMVTLPGGSYEEFPPTLADHAIRDRRWCQGNLQHVRLLGTAGLHWISRLQLLMGASSYLASPLWLLLLTIGLVEGWRGADPTAGATPAGWLLALTAMLLLGPRLLALLWLGADHDLRASLGGARRVLATVAIEIPLSMLVAPITMINQSIAVIGIACGKPAGWTAQRRDADGLALVDALALHRWHMGVGALFALAILAGAGGTLWTLPVALGLLASPVTAMITSRCDAGDRLRGKGLFLSPEEAGGGGLQPLQQHGRPLPVDRWPRLFSSPRLGPMLNP